MPEPGQQERADFLRDERHHAARIMRRLRLQRRDEDLLERQRLGRQRLGRARPQPIHARRRRCR